MEVASIKIRWITTTCFEVLLPNGKTLLLDPWTGKSDLEPEMAMERDFSVDDFTGADYVFVSHSHFDHFDVMKELLEKKQHDPCGGHVFLPALSAKALCEQYDIPLVDVTPLFPNETFYLDGLTVTALPCRHFGDKGVFVKDTPSQTCEMLRGKGYSEKAADLMQWGTLEEVDLAIRLEDCNFRFMVLGGRVYRFNNVYKFCEDFQPNFVIRQVSNGASPRDYAEMVSKYKASIVFPSHHDTHHLEIAQGMKWEDYFGEVNRILEEMGACTRVVNIEPLKWYTIGTFCE